MAAEQLETRTLLAGDPLLIAADIATFAGDEFQVNSTIYHNQVEPAIASDAEGNYVIVWASYTQDAYNTFGIYGQRFAADGTKLGNEFRVNDFTSNNQSQATISMTADGDFVVAWISENQGASGYDVWAKRYSSSGVSQGAEFRVNSSTANGQTRPAIAINDDGAFVVAWESAGDGSGSAVYARRFNASGGGLGNDFQVNTYTFNNQANAAVAIDAEGAFVVVWQSSNQDGSQDGIFAKRYDSDGMAISGDTLVNTSYTSGDQSSPAIAMDSAGNYVIAWSSIGEDGSNSGVYARRYADNGSSIGGSFQVNTTTNDHQRDPSIDMDAAGNFTITWESLQNGNPDVFAQRYAASGTPLGQEFQVNSYTTSTQNDPAIASAADGNFVIAWQSVGQDGNLTGIFAQRFAKAPPAVTSVTSGGAPIFSGATVRPPFQTLKIHFSEEMATSGAGDVTNPAFWQLTLNGQDVSSHIALISTQVVGGQTEVELQLAGPIQYGQFTLVALDGMTDLAGRPLDGDGDEMDGGDYSLSFSLSTPTEVTDEFLVNSTTLHDQEQSEVASDADGNYVIVWVADNPSGGQDIFAQLYLADGTPSGTEFQVSTYAGSNKSLPTVAMNNDGTFVVAWESSGQDGNSFGVHAQLFSALGVAIGSEIQANEYTTGDQSDPTVGIDANGQFVIAWHSYNQDGSGYGVYARRFDATGAKIGNDEFLINEKTESSQIAPSLSMSEDGSFVIAWSSYDADASRYVLFARQFADNNQPLTGAIEVGEHPTGDLREVKVGVDADGNFVVVWRNDDQDGDGYGIYARRFGSNGQSIDNEFLVNTRTISDQYEPALSVSKDGTFVIAWRSNDQDGDFAGVYAQRFSSNGSKIGEEFRLNATTEQTQYAPAVAMLGSRAFVATWTSNLQDGSGAGIYAQQFGLLNDAVGPFMIQEGEDLFLSAVGAAGNNVDYAWDLDGDGQFDDAFGATPGITAGDLTLLGIGDAGVYAIAVRLTEDQGDMRTVEATLIVNNSPPTVTVDQPSVYGVIGQTASVTGQYSDFGGAAPTLSASVGSIVDNLDGTWSWTLADVELSDSQTVTITAEDEDGGVSTVSFSLFVGTPGEAFLSIVGGTVMTASSGEAATLPEGLSSIHEWNTFTVAVWIRVDEQSTFDLDSVALNLNYNPAWFRLRGFTASSGVGLLAANDAGGSIDITADQLSAGDVGRDAYFLLGNFEFGPTETGGLANDTQGAYPTAASDLQFSATEITLSFAGGGDAPATQANAPTTQMQVVPYDSDDDGIVSLVDLAYLIRRIGANVNSVADAYRYDYDRDEVVSLVDLAYMIRNISKATSQGDTIVLPPPPSAATLESESVVLPASTSSAPPQDSATAMTFSPLEGESIASSLPSSPSRSETANVDAAFGNLGDQTDAPSDSLAETPAEAFFATISDPRQVDALSIAPDWALQALAQQSSIGLTGADRSEEEESDLDVWLPWGDDLSL